MAEITATASRIRPTRADIAEIYSGIAAEAITAGMPVYMNSDGKWAVSDANDAADDQCHGIAITSAASGGSFDYIVRGTIEGYTLTSVGYGSLVYVSNTVGSLDTAAGSTTIAVGKGIPTGETGNIQKLLYVDIPYNS